MSERYSDVNARTITRWIDEGWEWGQPIDHDAFERAKAGEWSVKPTPTKVVPRSWFGDLADKSVLLLAGGGGQQGPLFTAAGARVTVLDYTPAQLESERLVAEREGYDIELVRADMTQPLPFGDEAFDVVFNPVSLCYVREVEPIWREVARVLRPGGTLVTGFDTIINFLVDTSEERIVWPHPFDPVEQAEARKSLEQEDAGMQFGHDLTEMLGGMLRAGLAIVDLYEDTNGEGRLHRMNIPTYLVVRAVKG